MSLTLGNKFLKNGFYDKAIVEYEKIGKDNPLYACAQFNLLYIKRIKNKEKNNSVAEAFPVEKEPLLSIVMPVYNVAQYLDVSIVSALSQEYRNFELIIINDASTDDGKKIIDMHLSQDDKIKLINLEINSLGGAGVPSNIGIKAAIGDYIAFIDSDDWVKFGALSELLKTAVKYDADIVVGDFCTFDENDRKVAFSYDSEIFNSLPHDSVISLKTHPNLLKLSPVPWRKLYKRKFLLDNSILFPHVDCFYEDNPFHWNVLINAKKVILKKGVVSYHRMARPGQTMSASSYKLNAYFSHFNYISNIVGNSNLKDFLAYIRKTTWIVNRQSDEKIKNLFKKRFYQVFHDVANKSDFDGVENIQSLKSFFDLYNKSYRDYALTLIVDIGDLNSVTLKKILNFIEKSNKNMELFFVARSISDADVSSNKVFSRENVHLFNSGKVNNKWRSFNTVLPLCSGEFIGFADINDGLNSDLLSFFDKKVNSSLNFINLGPGEGVYNAIYKRSLVQNNNIFFGPSSEYGFYSFVESARVLSGGRGVFDINQLICLYEKKYNLNEFFAELNNYVQFISSANVVDSIVLISQVQKFIASIENKIDLVDHVCFRKKEIDMIKYLA